MSLADSQVSKLLRSITTVGQHPAQYAKEIGQLVFAAELSLCLVNGRTFTTKSNQFPASSGSDLDSRQILVGKYISLSSPKPNEYKHFASEFLLELNHLVLQLPPDSPKRKEFGLLVFHLELELAINVALKFFFVDDEGLDFTDESDPDDQIAIRRFKRELDAGCRPLKCTITPSAEMEDPDTVIRNLELDKVLRVFSSESDGSQFYRDRMDDLYDEFSKKGGRADRLAITCKQLVCELQLLVLGSPVPKLMEALNAALPVPQPNVVVATMAAVTATEAATTTTATATEAATTTTTTLNASSRKSKVIVPITQAEDTEDEEEEGEKLVQEEYMDPEDVYEDPEDVNEEEAIPKPKRVKWAPNTTTTTTTSTEPEVAATPTTTAIVAAEEKKANETEEEDRMMAKPEPTMHHKPRPKRAAFSQEEKDALKDGVAKYGLGNWTAILRDPKLAPAFTSIKTRTAINLKDLWRTMS
ncbi:hypothetical protein BASA81_000354 [Batrachochytrium salamandrivorans]|nr:hypothetical protein BASA81_000354 [Batrachochytrium salamandrivorans]